MQTIEFFVPMLIPRCLTPNKSRSVHWGAVTKAKNELQQAVKACAVDARNRYDAAHGGKWEPLTTALIFYTFDIPSLAYVRDDDNQIAGCKCVRDVLQLEYGPADELTGARLEGAGLVATDRQVKLGGLMWHIVKPSDNLSLLAWPRGGVFRSLTQEEIDAVTEKDLKEHGEPGMHIKLQEVVVT